MAVAQIRSQIGSDASTPAYRPVLDAMGCGELQEKLNVLIRQGRWDELGACIDGDLLHAVALVGTPVEVAGQIVTRYRGQVERVSPTAYIGNPEVAQALVLALRHELQSVSVQHARH